MNIYEAAKEVKSFVLTSVNENIVQTSGILGYCNGEIVKFRDAQEAVILNNGQGHLFEYLYRNGQVELKPIL